MSATGRSRGKTSGRIRRSCSTTGIPLCPTAPGVDAAVKPETEVEPRIASLGVARPSRLGGAAVGSSKSAARPYVAGAGLLVGDHVVGIPRRPPVDARRARRLAKVGCALASAIVRPLSATPAPAAACGSEPRTRAKFDCPWSVVGVPWHAETDAPPSPGRAPSCLRTPSGAGIPELGNNLARPHAVPAEPILRPHLPRMVPGHRRGPWRELVHQVGTVWNNCASGMGGGRSERGARAAGKQGDTRWRRSGSPPQQRRWCSRPRSGPRRSGSRRAG